MNINEIISNGRELIEKHSPAHNHTVDDAIREYAFYAIDYLPAILDELERLQETHRPKAQKDTSAFEAFYKAYPNKKSRGSAQKAWDKLNPDPALVKTIMLALEAQKKSAAWLEQGGRFIPYPATWLNNQRWADEISFVQIKSTKNIPKFDYQQREYMPGELDKFIEVYGGEDEKR